MTERRRLRILIASASATVRMLLVENLSQARFTLSICDSGQESRELMISGGGVDLAIVDSFLSDSSGEEFVQGLGSDPVTSEIPVIVLKASADTSAPAETHLRGVWELGKGFDLEVLAPRIE